MQIKVRLFYCLLSILLIGGWSKAATHDKLPDTQSLIKHNHTVPVNTISTSDIEPLSVHNPTNVKRVESILSYSDWDYLFPKRNKKYTYTLFLQAIGRFPNICQNYHDGRDADAICRRILATLFSHLVIDTGVKSKQWHITEWRLGLAKLREIKWTKHINYLNEYLKRSISVNTVNINTNIDNSNIPYLHFFQTVFHPIGNEFFSSAMINGAWLELTYAMYLISNNKANNTSIIEIIDGSWKPTEIDRKRGLTSGFGITTQIINGDKECNRNIETSASLRRIYNFRSFSSYLNVPIDKHENLGCKILLNSHNGNNELTEINW